MFVREVKVVEDNGQQGVFTKLSRPPRSVSHFTLANPNRIVIELEGDGVGATTAEQYPVDNPLVRQVRIGTHQGKMRITLTLSSGEFPPYTVDALNDTLVAFVGEPAGTSRPVREQIVFTQRSVPGARPPAPPAAVVASGKPEESEAETAETETAAAEPAPPAPAPEIVRPAAAVPPPPPPPPAPPAVAARPAPPPSPPTAPAVAAAPYVQTAETDHRGRGGKLYFGQPISLDLKDADIHNVLRLIAEVSKLNIVATDDVKGTITLRLFDVPWDQALDIILQVMNLESTQEGNVIRISTVRRLREDREDLARAREAEEAAVKMEIAYIHVNYAKAIKLGELISGAAGGQKGEQTGVLSPRGSVMVDEFTNTLIVRDIGEAIDAARDLIRRLDVQTPQILIESNIVEATADSARDLGIQWGYRASVGPQSGTSTGANFPGIIGLGGAGLGTGSGSIPFIADFPARGNFASGNGSALDLSLGSLDGVHSLTTRLSALEEEGRARVISRPRVMTLNNVAATIKSLTIIRVRLPQSGTNINTGAGGSVGGAQQATEKIETGIVLVVTPQVSSDGFILLDMFTKSSQADFSRQVDNIPTEITREATSHVLVRDGQTVVLGGIYRDQFTETDKGMPFMRDLPGLGWLFESKSKSKRREDLLVFLTPRVIGGTAALTGRLPSAAELWQHRGEEQPG